MSKNHYNNYSKHFQQPQNVEEQTVPTTTTAPNVTITASEIPPVVDATVPVPDETVEPDIVEAAPELPTAVTGIVSGCKKLNVRNKPSATAAILTTVNVGDEVEIAQPAMDGEFYKVTLRNGIPGYCMKKFITVK